MVADPGFIPQPPTITLSSQPTQVVITITPPMYGPAPTSYNIYKGTYPGAMIFFSNTTGLTVTDAAVTSDAYSHYQVTAVNSFGESNPTSTHRGRTTVSTIVRGPGTDYTSGGGLGYDPHRTPPFVPTTPKLAAALLRKYGIIMFVGDSLTAGYNAAGTNMVIKAQSAPMQMTAKFAALGIPTRDDAFFGTGDLLTKTQAQITGSINPDITALGGTWAQIASNSVRPVGNKAFQLLTNGTLGDFVFKPRYNAKSFDIWTGAFEANVYDSDGTTLLGTIPATGNTLTFNKITIPRSVSSTNPIIIRPTVNTQDHYLIGVRPYDPANPMLELWNLGDSGSTATTNWSVNGNALSAYNFIGSAGVTADAAIVQLGANDAPLIAAASQTPATFAAAMTSIVNRLKAGPGAPDVVLSKCNPAQPGSNDSRDIGGLLSTIDSVSTSLNLPAAINNYSGPSYVAGDWADGIHQLAVGYGKQSANTFAYLRAAVGI